MGDCDVKLPGAIIERLQREVDWKSANATERATALLRQALLEYVRAYLAGGNRALAEYQDKKQAVRLEEEFRGLLGNSPYLYEYVPESHRYLQDFPQGKPAGAEDFIYWSLEKFGLKPVLSVTHVTMHRRPSGPVLIASKQIYGSHYFDASLALTALIEGEDASGRPGFYLLYLNRSRADALRGGFSGLKRSLVGGKVNGGMKENMRLTKQRLENGAGSVGFKPE